MNSLKRALSGLGGFSGQILFNEPLAKYTWYQIGGPAQALVTPKTRSDLELLAQVIQETGTRFFILGAGSNVLVSDDGFPGLVIRANRFLTHIDVISADQITTGGGVMISSLVKKAGEEGWGGLELLSGIPGTVGGAIRMNAGTHLGETASRLKKVKTFDLNTGRESDFNEMNFAYRKNLFMPEGHLVIEAQWRIKKVESLHLKALIDETLARRKASQPVDQPSCGSVFKNPESSGLSAWQVMDRLGLRGHRIGDAQFSPKHSNFIVNLGGARATDIWALIRLAQGRAQTELQIALEAEVVVVK